MPPKHKSRKPRAPRRMARYLPTSPLRRMRMFNPQPVFTETYALTSLPSSAGGVLKFSMDQVPQLTQYNTLYQKYRILKARVLLYPEFNSFDQNQAENNAALSRSTFGLSRIAWAINDSPDLAAPTSELDVLKDNGCKIRTITDRGVKLHCSPVPNVEDANGVQMTFRKKFVNFGSPNIAHSGISYWISQLTTGTPGTENVTLAYVKLTFQLSDPR